MIAIRVNGTPLDVPDGETISSLLRRLERNVPLVAVEVNHEVIPRARHDERRLLAGDQVEIVQFVGGGL
jgi:sulfur carrier protein